MFQTFRQSNVMMSKNSNQVGYMENIHSLQGINVDNREFLGDFLKREKNNFTRKRPKLHKI